MKIAFMVGSLREDSFNKKLAQAIAARLPEGAEAVWIDMNVPLFSQDYEPDSLPDSVHRAVAMVQASDAVIVVSPEYNRSFSGVLKNMLDWLSRESVGYPLDKKIGAVAGASDGSIGTAVMQSHLRPVLAHIGMDIVALPEVFVSVPSRMSEAGEPNERMTKTLDAMIENVLHRVASK
ncbi:MAG TPA: NADPH-dependent FMN reductase [Patescibacteria group bacterium]|jgi:chromate reductase|nr:NADPH-dependent FMN reductase [Patescibacteria group bacterium]